MKADIPSEKGGPISVCKVLVHDTGIGELTIASQITETFIAFSSKDTGHIYLSEEFKRALDNLADNFVFCSGIAEAELKVSCSGSALNPPKPPLPAWPLVDKHTSTWTRYANEHLPRPLCLEHPSSGYQTQQANEVFGRIGHVCTAN